MQHYKLFTAVFLSACFLLACSGNKSSNNVTDNDTKSSSASNATSSSGDESFSCMIDGKDFSGKSTDEFANAALKTKPGIINFVLIPVVTQQKGIPAQFNFFVADKGVTTIHGADNPNYSVRYSEANTIDNYQCKDMTVTITSSGTSRVTGTFSGTLIEPKTDNDVLVTDGKFDIPYSPYSKK